MNKCLVALALAAASTSASGQTQPRLAPITTRGDGVFEATALSPDGSTVAGVVQGPDLGTARGYVACRWTLAAGLAFLPRSPVQLNWEPGDYPIALSSDGAIIGMTVGSRLHMVARWSLEFGYQVAPQLDSGNQQTEGRAMSADGRYIIGHASTNQGWRAFLANVSIVTNTNLQNVGGAVSVLAADAHSISAAGDKVVGIYQPQGTTDQVSCVWENGTTRTTLTCPPQFTRWFINRISGDGHVFAGGAERPQQAGAYVPVRWSAEQGAVLLPTLPGSSSTSVQFLDSSGTTLAGSCYINNVQQPVLWLPDGSVTTIDAYCNAHGLAHPGIHFDQIDGLSADGKVLLVTGLRGDTREGWMLRLPDSIPFCASDVGGGGGQPTPDGRLDNNDFITFIAYFFTRNARADVGKTGGLRGADFQLDNNDFIVFINQFFQGCE